MVNEVDLVVRARNEAKKAIDSVRDAVTGLRDAQDDLSKSAEKSGGPLGRFVDELTRLKSEAEGIRSLGKVKDSLEAIAARASRTETAVNKTAKALHDLQIEAAQTAAKTAQLKTNLDATKQALDRETEAFRKLRKENTAANNELAKAERTLASLKSQQAKTPSAGLLTKIADQEKVLAAAQAKQVDVAARFKDQAKAQTDAASALKTLNSQISASAAEERRLSQAIKTTTQQHLKNQRARGAANEQLEKSNTIANEVKSTFGQLATNEELIAKASADVAAQMQRVNAAMERQKQLDARTSQVQRGAPVDLASEINKQINVVAQARRELESVKQATADLIGATNRVGPPTRQFAQDLENLNIRARQGEQALKTESEALRQLEARMRAVNMERFSQSVATSGRQTRVLATDTRSTAQALAAGTSSSNAFKNALTGIYGEGRQALSLMQRLRGEILSLTASYLGFQAAVEGIRKVVDAFRSLEAAQNRLGAVFGQDLTRVGQEINFLRAQAQRLGIEFSTLSDEYSKFAVATQAAGFAQESTRKIFLAVAEAARVNKLSNEQLQGAFLALQQMASKGKVSAQELQQQLGERLPGAVTIFAQALGISNAELIKMQEEGRLLATEGNLLKFAEELNRRFGPQLQASLQSTTSEIGRFQNSLFNAALQVAAGGFIESFTNLLRTMNEFFASQEGTKFFLALGAALGRITDAVKLAVQNFELLKAAAAALVALKLTGFITSLVGGLRQSALAAREATGAQSALAAEMTLASGAMARMQGSLRALVLNYRLAAVQMQATASTSKIAIAAFAGMQMGLGALRGALALAATGFRALWVAMGGLPGLVITAITFALGEWLTRVESATAAIEEHKRILTAVNAAYENVRGTTKAWADEIKGATLSQALASAQKLREEYDKAIDSAQSLALVAKAAFGDFPSGDSRRSQSEQLVKLFDELRNGSRTLDQVTDALDKIALNPADAQIGEIAVQLLDMINASKDGEHNLTELNQALDQADAIIRVFKKDVKETDAALLGNAASAEKAAKSIEDKLSANLEAFNKIMGDAKKLVPELSDELERFGKIDALTKQYQAAAKLVTTMSQLKGLTDQFNKSVDAVNTEFGDKLSGSFVNKLISIESGGKTSAVNPNSSAQGLGQFISSTWLRMFKQYFPDRAQGMTDAAILALRKDADVSRSMIELYAQENAKALQASGHAVTEANLYLSHFLGSTGANKVLSASASTPISDILPPNVIDANKRILEGKNAGEVVAWAQKLFGVTQAQADLQAKITKDVDQQIAKQKEYTEGAKQRVAELEDELANNGKISKEMAIQKALDEERARAKEAGVEPDQKTLDTIRQATAAEWERNNALKANKSEVQQANQALAYANALATQRNALAAQLKTATAAGNTAVMSQTQTELDGVNTKLAEAIDKARGMWQAIGGPQADTAIAKLDALKTKTAAVSTQMSYFGLNMQQIQSLVGSFADGFANAFAGFVTAVAQGENAMKALKTAFIQFAANFLREIATMIIKQMILNALSGLGGPIGTAAKALSAGAGHSGGVVGASAVGVGNMRKRVSPAIFAGAMEYHTGGIVGLRPDEMPIIAKRHEEMLTEEDPRHRNNGGLAGAGSGKEIAIKNIVTLDPEFGRSMMQSSDGEHAVMSHIKKNRAAIKQMIR